MRIARSFVVAILLAGCAMRAPAAQPAPAAPTADTTAGWERYADAATGWSFAYPPGSRAALNAEEAPWYHLITPAADFPDGNVVVFGADNYRADNVSLARWVALREAVGERMIPVTAREWVMLDEDRGDPQGLLLVTPSVGLPGYTFYRVYGDLVIRFSGPGTPEMARFLPLFASTIQLTDAALAHGQGKPSLEVDYQATTATRQAVQSATPELDIVARDATAIAQLTPGPPATYSPEMQTQEAIYYRSLETATAVALLATPTPTLTPRPAATPIPSDRPGYALLRAPNTYSATPRLQVEYDLSQWSVSTLDPYRLLNQQGKDCALNLQGGARGMLGPAVVEWVTLGPFTWTRTDWRGDHVISYTSSDEGRPELQYFIIELRYAAEASREEVAACRVAAEQVLATIEVLD